MTNFFNYQQTLVYSWIRILFFLGIFLIPLFIVLDFFTTPDELFYPFMYARLIVSFVLLVMTVVVHFSGPSAIVQIHGYIFTAIVGGMIAWMTARLGGFDSGYYAGLNLVVISVNLIIPWRFTHTVVNGIFILLLYIGFNLIFPNPFDPTHLINNLFFLSSTVFITAAVSWLRYDLIKKEYLSRQKADQSQMEEIAQLAGVAERLSSGDFTVQLDFQFQSTAGILLSAFRKMSDDLKGAIAGVTQAAGNVENFARRIRNHTHDMAEGTQRQSVEAEQSVATVRTLADQIKQSAEEAARFFDVVEQGEKRASQSREGIQEALQGMRSIEEIVTDLSTKVKNLEESSRRIGDIIKAIIEIADQTNMLALNASIEAARAGEHGRGFAIVAEQVGKLADRTADATRETNSIISAIQNDIGGAIDAMHTGTDEIKRTMTSVEKVSNMARDVSDFTSSLSAAVRDMAETGRHQAESSQEINTSIESIQNITTATANSVQEVAVAAEELHDITEKLNSLVSGFRT